MKTNTTTPHQILKKLCMINDDEQKIIEIDDTNEAIETAISQGASSISSMSFSWIPDKNKRVPTRYGDLYLLVQKSSNFETNLTKAMYIITSLNSFGVDLDSLYCWISSQKGIHIKIPSAIYGGENGDIFLPNIHKEMVLKLMMEYFGKFSRLVDDDFCLDFSPYAVFPIPMIEIENVCCSKNKRYKVPVTPYELLENTPETLWKMTEQPRHIQIIHSRPERNSFLSELYNKTYSYIHRFAAPQNSLERLAGLECCEFIKYCTEYNLLLTEEQWKAMVYIFMLAGKTGEELVYEFSKCDILKEKVQNDIDLKTIVVQIPFDRNVSYTCEQIQSIFRCNKNCHVKSPIDLFQNNISADSAEVTNYILKSDGLYYIEHKEEKDIETKISSPIAVTYTTRDMNNCSWGKRIKLRDMDGIIHELTIKSSELHKERGGNVIEKLVDNGLVLSPVPNAEKLLKNYLISSFPYKKGIEVDRCGWHQKCFILYNECIGGSADITYFPSFKLKDNLFQCAGSLEDWKRKIAKPLSGHTLLEFTMCLGFAAVLLTPLGLDTFGVNLRGEGSTGKTTALKVAGSVCGGSGQASGYLRQWRATDNALESIAAKHNDMLLTLDELGQADSKSIGKSIYMIGNGETKSRLNQDAEERGTRRFKTVVLSSGEITLQDKISAEKGSIYRAGQAVRIIDIDISAIPNNKGIFSFVPDEMFLMELGILDVMEVSDKTKLSMFSDYIKEQSIRYYGTAIRKFLEAFISDYDKNTQKLRENHHEYIAHMTPLDADSQVIRVIRNFALVAAVGEFAIEQEVLPWEKGEVEKATQFVLGHWLKQRNGAKNLELTQAIERLIQVIQQDTICFKTIRKREYPYKDELERATREPIGYKKEENGRWIYFIENAALKSIYRGISKESFIKELDIRDWLVKNKNGKPLESLKVPDKDTAHGIAVYQDKIGSSTD